VGGGGGVYNCFILLMFIYLAQFLSFNSTFIDYSEPALIFHVYISDCFLFYCKVSV